MVETLRSTYLCGSMTAAKAMGSERADDALRPRQESDRTAVPAGAPPQSQSVEMVGSPRRARCSFTGCACSHISISADSLRMSAEPAASAVATSPSRH